MSTSCPTERGLNLNFDPLTIISLVLSYISNVQQCLYELQYFCNKISYLNLLHMTSFQFATRITNAILSGQSHVNFCYRIMCRFNLFAIIRMRFKPLARRNFYVKNFLLLANERNEDFFAQNAKLNWILLLDPCLKDFDQKIVSRLT